METEESSKKIILAAALHEFSDKGFDGARIDAIAKRSGLNKALIYYYFKNKEALLDAIFEAELAGLDNYTKTMTGLDIVPDKETLLIMMDKFLAYAEEKKEIISLVMSESIIGKRGVPYILKVVDYAVRSGDDLAKQYTELIKLPSDRVFHEMFTGMLPLFQYILFKDEMSRYYQVPLEELKMRFIEFFIRVHMGYEG